jgi:flagellar basal body-associated protein FliL
MTTEKKKSKVASFFQALLLVLAILVVAVVLGLVSVMQKEQEQSKAAAKAVAASKRILPNPVPYTSIDGCTVYRFMDEDGKNYFARCTNGKVSTSDTKGRHVITEATK